jgi:hypothetical protein
VPTRRLGDPRVRAGVCAGQPDLRHDVVFFAHEPFYDGGQVGEGNEEHTDTFGRTSGSLRLGEDDPVVVHNVAGYEFIDEPDPLVVDDLLEEPFGHPLVLLY